MRYSEKICKKSTIVKNRAYYISSFCVNLQPKFVILY